MTEGSWQGCFLQKVIQLAAQKVAVSSPAGPCLCCAAHRDATLMDEPLSTSLRCSAPPAAHLNQGGRLTSAGPALALLRSVGSGNIATIDEEINK